MRIAEILNEGQAKRVTAETGRPFVIVMNPDPNQLRSLMGVHYGCKGMLSPDGRRILVWNAYFAEHYIGWNLWHGIENRFSTTGDIIMDPEAEQQIALEINQDGVYANSAHIDDFKAAPAVLRMFAGPFEVGDSIETEMVTPR